MRWTWSRTRIQSILIFALTVGIGIYIGHTKRANPAVMDWPSHLIYVESTQARPCMKARLAKEEQGREVEGLRPDAERAGRAWSECASARDGFMDTRVPSNGLSNYPSIDDLINAKGQIRR